jgi:small-conductance mechanosensitive channel
VGEGYVRRIAVRATEIETFDRASLIVPNSELISHAVTNLTHRNQLGRLNINVRVSYAADPVLAQRVLQEVADANTSILRHPPPLVVLDNLGEQALEYSVRVYLVDINRSLQVQTEVRTEIVNALRSAGIDIPYFAVQVGHANGPRLAPDRVTVKIGAALKSDPEAVQDALRAAAQGCSGARADPAPEIAFDNVGDTALEFSVSVAVAEGADAKRVQTALRTAIVKTLHQRGIDIAGQSPAAPQRDLDALRGLVRRGEEPARAQREGAPTETATPK